MNDKRLNELFVKYLDDSLTEQEEAEFLFALQRPTNKQRLEILFGELWQETLQTNFNRADKQSVKRIAHVMKHLPPRRRSAYRYRLAAACISLMIVAFGITYYQIQSRQVWMKVVANAPLTYHSLPDGSLVILKQGSTLYYYKAFSKRREVKLIGQAFFDVTNVATHPFTVKTAHMQTKVLGTAFSINASPNSGEEVILLRGSVQVKALDKQVLLKPNMKLRYKENKLYYGRVDAARTLAWSSDSFHIEDQPLSQLVNLLGRRFKKTIVFQNKSIARRQITTTFSMNDSLEDILDVVCLVNGLKWQNHREKIIIVEQR